MKPSTRSGFSLIELLSSIALLILIMLMVSRIFTSSASLWRLGNKRIESNNSGRAALEFMSRELAGLIVADVPTMSLNSDADNYLGMRSDRLTFVTLSHKAEYRSGTKYRDVQQVCYAVAPMPGYTGRYGLYRWVTEDFGSAFFSSYQNPTWYTSMEGQSPSAFNAGVLAENVRNFEVFITPEGETDPKEDYVPSPGKRPATIDIYLEVLAEDDAARAEVMPGNDPFVVAATRRYATRIYFNNRAGYAD